MRNNKEQEESGFSSFEDNQAERGREKTESFQIVGDEEKSIQVESTEGGRAEDENSEDERIEEKSSEGESSEDERIERKSLEEASSQDERPGDESSEDESPEDEDDGDEAEEPNDSDDSDDSDISEDPDEPVSPFDGLDSRIARAMRELNFQELTPIQKEAIPVLMEGRDVIGQAQTGTGKTAAFGIPLLQKVDPEDKSLQAMVLCPTRELAMQAAVEIRKYAKFLFGIKVLPVYGGEEIFKQINALKGVQIVIGTPGRVMDHMRRKTIRLDNVRTVVLDEADVMLDMGFREDMETILKELPEEHQTALFSATMPPAILELARTYQKDAEFLKITQEELTVAAIRQYYYEVGHSYKTEACSHLLEFYAPEKCLIFVNTKKMADELSETLKKRQYPVDVLHGDLTQGQRDFVMSHFRNGQVPVLVATDVAARGIDVDDVQLVINYDLPDDTEYYVHRIGRTGRAGKDGLACTIICSRERSRLHLIEQVCKTKIERKEVPSAEDVTIVRAGQILKDALAKKALDDTGILTIMVHRVAEESGISPETLAVALLNRSMGGAVQDIPPVEHKDRRKRRSEHEDGERVYGRHELREENDRRHRRDVNQEGTRRRDSEGDSQRRDFEEDDRHSRHGFDEEDRRARRHDFEEDDRHSHRGFDEEDRRARRHDFEEDDRHSRRHDFGEEDRHSRRHGSDEKVRQGYRSDFEEDGRRSRKHDFSSEQESPRRKRFEEGNHTASSRSQREWEKSGVSRRHGTGEESVRGRRREERPVRSSDQLRREALNRRNMAEMSAADRPPRRRHSDEPND